MNNQMINLNEVLANFQKSYPNLAGFKYDQGMDALVYEGNYIRLNGYMLSRINPTLFSMSPDDIFTYLKNGFYYNTDENGLLNNLLSKLIITDEEAVFIKNYIKSKMFFFVVNTKKEGISTFFYSFITVFSLFVPYFLENYSEFFLPF